MCVRLKLQKSLLVLLPKEVKILTDLPYLYDLPLSLCEVPALCTFWMQTPVVQKGWVASAFVHTLPKHLPMVQ